MLRAVIFDFDGVITDSEIIHLHSFNRVLAQYGMEITTEDYYKDYLGLTDADVFTLLADQNRFGPDAEPIENLIKQKNQIFEELARTEGRIIPGVCDFLGMLNQNNIPMAICSGALRPEIELILKQARLRHLFKVIVSAEQIKKGKPNPEGFLLTLAKLNEKSQESILPDECIVIEDSNWGLEAAKAAGMHTIAVTNSYDAKQLATAEKIVKKLSDLSMNDLQKLCN
jgi:beta-phosphoglucomutase